MNMSKKFDKRKKVVYDLICDDLYTPMKFKELAMLLRVAKEDRDELRQILRRRPCRDCADKRAGGKKP